MKKVLRLPQSWSHTPDRMEKFSPNQKKKIGGIAPSVIFSWLRHYRGIQDEIQKNMAEGEYRSNFGGKNIWLKYKIFDAVFYADSEYHVYFAPISTIDSENHEIRELRPTKKIFSLVRPYISSV